MNVKRVRATKNPRILWLSIAILLLLFGLMAFFQGGASAAVFSVDNVGDAVDMFPGDGFCATSAGLCTLRAAIMEANASPGPDVIALSSGIYNLSIGGPGEDGAATGDLDITDTLTIRGTGMSFTVIDGLALDRVFHIAPTPADFKVSIEGLTIRGGNASPGGGIHNAARLTLDNVSVLDSYPDGIYNEGPALTLIDSEVRLNGVGIMSFSPLPPLRLVTLTNTNVEDNQGSGVDCRNTELTVQGGAISGNGFSGVWGNGCEMTFNNVMILNNTTPGDGGGIMSGNYAPVVNGGVIGGNQAANKGGGIYYWGLVGRELQMTGVLVENNEASAGGGLYVDGAIATLDGVTLRDNRALENGGGIYLADNNDATLNLLNGTQVGQAGHGNASDADGDSSGVGAGIYNIGTLNIESSTVSYNAGDGIWNEGPAMSLTDSVVSYNDGQGIYTFSSSPPLLPVTITDTDIVGNEEFGYYGINGDLVFTGGSVRDNQNIGVLVMTNLTMSGATVSGNASSSHGGGLYLANIATATITDTTISGNTAVEDGGGVYYWGLSGGELSLTNVTISGNEADGNGGGIVVESPAASILNMTNVTLSGNRADADLNGAGEGDVIFTNGTLNLVNTILNGNGSGSNCAGSLADIFSQGHNLSNDASCPLGAVGDQPNTDPLLGPLQDNGGPTETHALPFGSPAINAGDDSRCPPADQRGVTRPQGVSCDVGAFEMVWDMCALQTEIPESECQALEDLYNSTDGDNWTDNTDWLITPAPCNWFGVTCSSGHVTRLDLHRNGLNGELPGGLGNLTYLRVFYAADNQLSGPVPPELGNLSQLEELALSENQLAGPIPPEIGNMQNLTALNLGMNQLNGEIPSSLGNLNQVTYLILDSNNLSGNVPASLGNVVLLETLYLSNNPNLTGPLPLTLTNLVSMETFLFHNTDLCEPPDAAFQAWLVGIQDVSSTGVTCTADVCAVQTQIPERECRALEDLYNSTDGKSWTDNTDWLTSNTPCSWFGVTCAGGNVFAIDLANNGLNGVVPPSMGDFVALDTLILHENQLSGSIPPELGDLPNLRQLGAWSNQLEGGIPPSLGNLTKLEMLQLGVNQLSGPIPPELGNLANLINLGLSWNQLSGSIPPSLGNLTNLEQLVLSHNQLSGPIPPELGNMPSLTYLVLMDNQLSGSIPPELGGLIQLNYLSLFSNQLSGSIPTELGDLTNLIQLGLESNQLSGSIPASIGNLTNLESLQLAYNQLSGTIPSNFGNLVAIEFLTLNDNPGLTGPLPLTMTYLVNLNTFRYFNTDLCEPPDAAFQAWLGGITELMGTGVTCAVDVCAVQTEIPESECRVLENLYNSTDGHGWTDSTGWMTTNTPCSWKGVMCISGHVSALQLVENNLNGPLPESLVGLTDLRTLDLSHNLLTGSVPPEYGTLSSLELLGLSYNLLSGNIPPELGDLKNLTNLELGFNDLSGSIPPELGNLANLVWLYLFDNRLSGDIPSQLGNLAALQVLFMPNNQLTGTIPPELGNLTNLISLGLDNNQLSGPIPADLGDLTSLRWLTLSGNQLSGSIPIELGNLSNLTSLLLGNNQLSGTIPVELGNLINLTSLSLSENRLVGEVPASLGNLVALQQLWLYGNASLTGSLPLSLTNLAVMQEFFYYETDLCNPPDATFQAWLAGISDLRGTDVTCLVDFCAVQTEIPIGECRALEDLYNSTDGVNWTDNTGWLATDTPCSWYGVTCAAGHVTEINMLDNRLSGVLPASLADLSELMRFSLFRNQLMGSIPPHYGSFTALTFLDLSENQLSGSIPPELGNLSNLQVLSLGYNQLSGPIPPELGNLTNVTSMLLEVNQLSGNIPSELGNLSSLVALRAFSNEFSGPIPPELGNLSNLVTLVFGGNQLSGNIPPQLGDLTNLEWLNLSGNQLSGAIPIEIANLTELESLMLAGNQLDGAIPAELGNLTHLTHLLLGSNQLVGTVPDSLGNLVLLENLNLSANPGLTGPLPLSLTNLSVIQVFNYYDTDLCNPQDAAFQAWLAGIPTVSGTGVDCGPDVCAVQTEIPLNECRALEDLYNSTDGHSWRENTDWLATNTPCSWFGITCRSGHVDAIDLSLNDLNGSLPASIGDLPELVELILNNNLLLGGDLPPELGNLSNLNFLHLRGNSHTGSIPESLGNLTHLMDLRLDENQLSGPIPPELGNMTQVRVFEIWGNRLTGSIPAELGNLSYLEYFDLSENQLSGSIPEELGKLSNLEYLDLNSNRLTGSIPATLGDLSQLQELHLWNNLLSGNIPAELGNLSSVDVLSLAGNALTGPIPPELGNLSQMTGYLNLDNNNLTGPIPPELGNLTDLTSLGLFNNQLTGPVPAELGNLTNLLGLYLSGNQLSGELPDELGNLLLLRSLWLNDNPDLTGPLPLSLTSLSVIQVFNYYDTDLCNPQDAAFQAWLAGIPTVSGTGVDCGPDVCAVQTEIPLNECRALEDLYYSTNGDNWTDNTGWLVTVTPCSWFGVTCASGHVTVLDLNSNQLNGPIPATLSHLGFLNELHLWNNQLTGTIPPALGGLAHIDILTLAGNQLTGSIPPELGNLTPMRGYLNLDNNNLSGPIPPELGNLTDLTSLGLFNNQLTGPVPAELGNLTNLLGLYLSGNQLSGELPDELGNLLLLRSLWLHDNPGLTGMLPLTLADLLFMETFYFDNTDLCEPPHPWFQVWLNGTYDVRSTDVTCDIPFCSMVTEIPRQECEALEALYISTDGDNWNYNDGWMDRIEPCTWIGLYCQAGHVVRMDLQGRGLNGPLPSEIGQLEYLEYLNLHDNQLSGPIPSEIGNLAHLEYLSLSENQLTGSIPASFGNLSSLQSLSLRNNQLSGSLPPSLGQLSNLEYLSLGENPFTGTLPPEWGDLSQLTYLSIYRNPISGTIPPEWGKLSNLEDLRIVSTQIGGVIPAEFGNLTALEFLTLADNQLTGPLPPELGNLPNLLSLWLEYNQLTGTLPDAWGNLPNILVIEVYSNPLSGPVPMSFINLSTLNSLGFKNTNICEPPEPAFQDWLDNLAFVQSTDVICPNTGTGTDVVVNPIDYASGTTPVTMTFTNVLWEGYTSLEITDSGPEPPDGLMLGDPPTYYQLETTAAYYGVEICIDYTGVSYVDESDLALYHYEEGIDEWVDVTTSHDMANDVICGYVEFLSPFAVFEEMNKPPVADPNGPYEAEEGAALAFDATGSSDPDGDELIYAWDFGDGEVGSGATPAHAYGDDGEFVVTLVVSDPEGLSDSATTTATIHNVEPSIDAGDDVSLLSGEVLSIAADFTDPGALDTHTATIDFGTGDGPEDAAVIQGAGWGTVSGSRQYLSPGTYNIEVCVRDDDGGEACDALVLHVEVVPVEIDIWPYRGGHWPACRSSRSIIPVAILSSATFDATSIDPLTVRFGPDEAHVIQWKRSGRAFAFLRDVNRDGLVDLTLYFRYGDTGLTCESEAAVLYGQTVDGIHFLGEDNIKCWPWWRHSLWSKRWRK